MEREVYNQIYKIKMIKNNKVGNNNDNKDRDNVEAVIYVIIYLFMGKRNKRFIWYNWMK